MPVVSSLANLPKDGEFYSNNCVDGHCIGCGECCTDLLPTTDKLFVFCWCHGLFLPSARIAR